MNKNITEKFEILVHSNENKLSREETSLVFFTAISIEVPGWLLSAQ